MAERSRKSKVKRPDWQARCMEAATDAETAQEMYLEIETERDALTEQLKAKDARIAELEDKIQKAKTLCDKWDELCTARAEQVNRLTAALQATRDRDDELMAAQRERLIRLTEIKNSMAHFIQSYWEISEGTTAIELDGTMWMKFHHAENADHWVNNLEADIAALEVDSTLPGIPPKRTDASN